MKKSKLQVLKLFFMKNILERKFKKIFSFPVFLNFRNLTLTSKKNGRLRTNQLVVFKDFFFINVINYFVDQLVHLRLVYIIVKVILLLNN